MSTVLHVFFEVNMGKGFPALTEMLTGKINRVLHDGECAVFLNSKWSGAKILYPGNVLIYWRNEMANSITYDELRALPSRLAEDLEFSAKAERALITATPEQRVKRRKIAVSTEDEATA